MTYKKTTLQALNFIGLPNVILRLIVREKSKSCFNIFTLITSKHCNDLPICILKALYSAENGVLLAVAFLTLKQTRVCQGL